MTGLSFGVIVGNVLGKKGNQTAENVCYFPQCTQKKRPEAVHAYTMFNYGKVGVKAER